MSFLTKVFGTRNDKLIKGLKPIVDKINSLEESLKPLTDEQLRAKSDEYRQRIAGGESLDAILPEAFATCREASSRILGMRHFDVQLIGGIVLHQGKIAEMKTGEGKTLTATLPVYLHGLSGLGAHVVTVNDYLAKRDAEWMAKLYNFLGLTCGSIVHGLSDQERKEAYGCDITYGTNNEFGFDYLRDNMKTDPDRLVQRGHNFAIVDEVDSILIDEARTPLIISGPADTNKEIYGTVNAAIPGLQKDSDYTYDEKSRSAALTEDGINKMEKRLRVENLYDPANIEYLHHVQQALKAHICFKKDVDYVVRDGQVVIVDEFTGRLMPGRRYSDGLHGALEAKEHVPVQQETQTLATITFQNYFRIYTVLAGMTGTADTEAVEFHKIYGLDVVVIPTNKPISRKDEDDVIFMTAREKFEAIAAEIDEAQQKGQPVLVGTVSVERSELLSSLLKQRNVEHSTLNAKNHAKEASIIENAGQKARVTIATNMAGRGTDIVLGEGVREAGGLYVIASERHDSRRIDNQLRGRSGRQGDPGRSKFFLSLEDDLMRIFASDKLTGIMQRLGMKEGESIVSPMVTRAIEKAQKRVEEQNFGSRKHVLEYDDVMNQQRQVIYKRRRKALEGESDIGFMPDSLDAILREMVTPFSPENTNSEKWDFDPIIEKVKAELGVDASINLDRLETSVEGLAQELREQCLKSYEDKMKELSEEDKSKVEAYIYLQLIDQSWKEHLLSMDALKDSVSLRGYGQRDPLQEYKKEAFNLFSQLIDRIESETAAVLVRMPAPTMRRPEELRPDGNDLESYDYDHPDAAAPSAASGNAADGDKMVYHGSRSQLDEQSAPRSASGPARRSQAKVGRNDPCPCGSGKKFKKCHGLAGMEASP